jgi:phosphatidylglycerol---prolipoprotein diacylglyceryl transferase
MLPILFSIGPFTLYTYGLFLFVAIFFSLFVIWKRGREAHFDEEDVVRFGIQMTIWGMLGARIAYVLIHFQTFQADLFQVFNVFGKPGYEFIGGLLAMTAFYLIRVKKLKWEMWSGLDVLIMGLILWKAIMSLADFFNGSGAGLPTQSFLGVYFSGMYEKRLPIQLVEFIFFGGLFYFLWWVESHYRTYVWYKGTRSEANSGFIVGSAILFMGIILFIADTFRPERILLVSSLRLEMVVSLLFIILGMVIFHIRSGLGVNGIVMAWLKEWGITGSFVERWKRKREVGVHDQLKLGRDIFE